MPEMLFSFKNKYQYTYLNTYLALYFCTPKLPENTHTTDGKSFQPQLTLVSLLTNYPHSHYSPPSLGVPPSHTPLQSFHKAHKKWGKRAEVGMCSGKYIDIYF